MNRKKLKIIILIGALILLLLVIITTLVENTSKKNSAVSQNNEETSKKEYNFNETIDLDTETIRQQYDPQMGTDYPNLGTISDYYDNTDVRYEEDKVYIQSYNGHDVVSTSWQNEGYAVYINEPKFGELEKFVLSSPSISASYTDVKMKDVISYINELSGLGFNDVVKDNRNNGNDYYIYSAKKENLTVTLNYEKEKLLITVF